MARLPDNEAPSLRGTGARGGAAYSPGATPIPPHVPARPPSSIGQYCSAATAYCTELPRGHIEIALTAGGTARTYLLLGSGSA
jgi:hypothetical protein